LVELNPLVALTIPQVSPRVAERGHTRLIQPVM
jgi:hypothetical protein